MILYHGSNTDIEQVDLLKSKKNKDFGRAFYLSDSESQAYQMAQFRVKLSKKGEAVVNKYYFDEQLLDQGSPLQVKSFPHYSSDWARFIWDNRNDDSDFAHPYDIVYGPIADDTVGFQLRLFKVSGGDLSTFLEGLKYSKGETFQYAFCTQEAINHLKKI